MIPSVSADAIRQAMTTFDADLRDTKAWVGWEANKSHKYAIAFEGKRYPAKQIISIASNTPVADFNGGYETNNYLIVRGFVIEPLQLPSEAEIQLALHELLLQRHPSTVSTRDAYDVLAKTFKLSDDLLAQKLDDGSNHWENRVRQARRKLVAAGHLDGSDRGAWKLAVRDLPRIWMEKTLVAGRPDRMTGDYAVGQALWSPQRDRSNTDTYALMREVQPGDVVIHLVDNKQIAGASIVDSYVDLDFTCLEGTEWAGKPGYLVKLRDFAPCTPPVPRSQFLSNPSLAPQLQAIRASHKNLFYDRDLNLNQGFYLSTVPPELATLLNQAAGSDQTAGIPHLNSLHLPVAIDADVVGSSAEQTVREPQTWIYAPGAGAEFWDEFHADGVMAIGWDELGDLAAYADVEAIKQSLKDIHQKDADPNNDALACYEFANDIRPGDLVFAKRGRSRVVGYGVVLGDYHFDGARAHFKNYRRVRWEGRGDWEVEAKFPLKTLTNFTKYPELVDQLKKLVGLTRDESFPQSAPLKSREPFTVDQAMEDLLLDREEFERMLQIWRSKKNLILQGPPGVGKTFIAKRLAYALLGFKDPSRVKMVQFHQSYSYEDFVQGYRPVEGGLKLQNGLFLDFCASAASDSDTEYVFIIDEINRGNLSRIFGELMMLIEPDKRGSAWSVPLTYATTTEEQFYIPEKVHILGLMNTADRSLAMVDYALRRRFAFWMMKPQLEAPAFRSMLTGKGVPPAITDELVRVLVEINEAITKDTASLGAGYCIGHSFFCSNVEAEQDPIEWLQNIIDAEILPLMGEYWADSLDKVERWTGRLRSLR